MEGDINNKLLYRPYTSKKLVNNYLQKPNPIIELIFTLIVQGKGDTNCIPIIKKGFKI